jgi:hypothetical protein
MTKLGIYRERILWRELKKIVLQATQQNLTVNNKMRILGEKQAGGGADIVSDSRFCEFEKDKSELPAISIVLYI